MNIPYVSVSYLATQARRECNEYVAENHENVKKVRYIHPFQVVKNDGTEIFFMSEITFRTWCKGRRYKILGSETVCRDGRVYKEAEGGN